MAKNVSKRGRVKAGAEKRLARKGGNVQVRNKRKKK